MSIIYPELDPKLPKLSEEQRVFLCLARDTAKIHRFIEWGEPSCKRGPGDLTGASLAFNFYDFINGTYRYTR